jgi:hypothetical protein
MKKGGTIILTELTVMEPGKKETLAGMVVLTGKIQQEIAEQSEQLVELLTEPIKMAIQVTVRKKYKLVL